MRQHKFLFRLLLLSLLMVPFAAQAQDTPAPSQGGSTLVIEKASPLSISGILEICKGSETLLKAEGEFESFTWDKGSVKGRLLRVSEEGKYEVTAKTKAGCTYTTSVMVRVRPCS